MCSRRAAMGPRNVQPPSERLHGQHWHSLRMWSGNAERAACQSHPARRLLQKMGHASARVRITAMSTDSDDEEAVSGDDDAAADAAAAADDDDAASTSTAASLNESSEGSAAVAVHAIRDSLVDAVAAAQVGHRRMALLSMQGSQNKWVVQGGTSCGRYSGFWHKLQSSWGGMEVLSTYSKRGRVEAMLECGGVCVNGKKVMNDDGGDVFGRDRTKKKIAARTKNLKFRQRIQ